MISQLRIIISLCFVVWLTACGGGGGGSDSPASQPGNSNEPISPTPDPGDPEPPAPDDPTDPPTPEPDPSDMKSVTLSWTTPSSRVDGNPLPLTEIGGYEIYYFMEGSSQGEGETLLVADPMANQVTTPRLVAGTYYFAIASYDVDGIYSELSDYVTANLQ